MPARKKPEHQRKTATLPLRLSPEMKAELDRMADETGVSLSQMARECFEERLRKWKATKSAS